MIKKRILLFGSNGLVGSRLAEHFRDQKKIELLCASSGENSIITDVSYRQVDISERAQVKKIINNFYPDFIINAAAFTNVDKCEEEKEKAWKINVEGTENLMFYSRTLDAHLIHFSTDYIFDGEDGPYSENDRPNPINYYGRTKLASENLVKTSPGKWTILRINVPYGNSPSDKNDFVKWTFNSLSKKKPVSIVTDQINNPTFIDDIVDAVSRIVSYKREGVYQLGGRTFLSRYDFAMRIADFFELDRLLITPINTKDLNQIAFRPLNSGLLTIKAETQLNYKPTPIEETFRLLIRELYL
jgi:dTDP-4-dehydrorhamnose reductase